MTPFHNLELREFRLQLMGYSSILFIFLMDCPVCFFGQIWPKAIITKNAREGEGDGERDNEKWLKCDESIFPADGLRGPPSIPFYNPDSLHLHASLFFINEAISICFVFSEYIKFSWTAEYYDL